MENKHRENSGLPLDTGLLSDFIFELTINSRCVSSYPKDHPFTKASLEKVMKLIPKLFEFREEINLGIARDTLILDQAFLDKKNPVYREYAKILFRHNIVGLTFEQRIEFEELVHFNEILALSPQKILEQGGIERAVENADIRHIRVKAVAYDQFRVTEKEQVEKEGDDKNPSAIWENFARYLLDGTLDPAGVRLPFMDAINPELLARAISEDVGEDSQGKEASYSELISSYLKKVSGSENEPGKSKAYIEQLTRFVNQLNPELRRQLLSDSFKGFKPKEGIAQEVSDSREEAILEALGNMNSRGITPSPHVLGLLQKLTKHFRKSGAPERNPIPGKEEGREQWEKLITVFRQQEGKESLVPETYQNTLQRIMATKPISSLDLEEIEALKKSVDGQWVDAAIFTIIVEIIKSGLGRDNLESLKQNLVDSCRFFLEIGDFQTLNDLHGKLMDCNLSALTMKSSQMFEITSIFNKPEFAEEVLNGLRVWGKERYPYIQKLILKVGPPFLDPVLNRLAEEPSLSIRRFLIDCLLEMGETTRNAVLMRLRDKRWYFVRNLVLILRNLNDPWVLPPIRKLMEHPHPRVREEAFKTLLHFQDPDAHQLLLKDLSGKDKEAQLTAIGLAENSQSSEVAQKLIELLNKGNVLRSEMDLKKRIIQTLGRIGNPAILPHLEGLLKANHLLHRNALSQLKAEIIRSLEYYPGQESVTIAENLSRGRDEDLANLAIQTLKNMRARVNL
jgi:hypothetical protein